MEAKVAGDVKFRLPGAEKFGVLVMLKLCNGVDDSASATSVLRIIVSRFHFENIKHRFAKRQLLLYR